MLASAADADLPDDDTFRLVKPVRPRLVDGIAFHLSLPMRVARELRDFEPDAVLVHGAHDVPAVLLGRRLARSARFVNVARQAPQAGSAAARIAVHASQQC